MKINKFMKNARFYALCALICGSFASCQDEQVIESSGDTSSSTRAVVTPSFDWENADWMPTPPTQSQIPSPWIGQGSIASVYGIDVINDRKASDGWELMYSSFDATAPGQLVNPYFVLYNKYRGIMRIFLYITTQFVSSSSYLQDGISIVSNQQTSMLNFLGQDMIDTTVNQTNYAQMQPAPTNGSFPLASNKWYMMQYEMAYDPNLSQIPYNSIQLNWYLNYYNVEKVSLGGNIVGKINGVIGSSSGGSNMFSSLMTLGKTVGTGVLAGIGQDYITKNTINEKTGENTLGLPNKVFSSLASGVSKALSGAAGGLPGAAIGFLSGIIGGSSAGPTPISLNLKADIKLEGTGTNGGSFPSTPISFWVPGTNIASNAVGYIPLYNKSLGVIHFSGKPTIVFNVDYEERYEPDEPFDPDRTLHIITYNVNFPFQVDYSSYLKINPEVLKIAEVTIERQDLVYTEPEYDYINHKPYTEIVINPTSIGWETGGNHDTENPQGILKFGVRFTIKVKPLNGDPSSIIIKTLSLVDQWI